MNPKLKWVVTSVLVVVILGVAGLAQGAGTAEGGLVSARLQAVLEASVAHPESDYPGTLLYASSPEDIIWTGAAGVADIETGTPMGPNDRFRAGSIMKPFIAAVVLQLVEEGQLSLDDTLGALLPVSITAKFSHSDGITLRMLLNHTSGIPDFLTGPVYAEIVANPTKIWTDEEWLDIAASQEPYFAPGQGWHYSNTNYILIGMVIEQVTGRTWRSEVHERVIARLSLGNTILPEPGDLAIPGQYSHGYSSMDGVLVDVTAVDPSMAGAAGGSALVTTASDLARFLDALLAGKLFQSPATLHEMLTFVEATHESGLPYYYGLGVAKFVLEGGVAMVGHAGGTAGFHSAVYHLPAMDTTIVAMVNTMNPWGFFLKTFFPALEVLADTSSGGTKEIVSSTVGEQDVQFENGEIRLAGTLVLPDGPGPHPAMVIVHGSGAADRHNWEEHTKHFPSLGVALLKFDKRGVGESAGNWLTASMPTLADDVLAGVKYLQQRSDINPKQVGVWGGSQGWTVGSLAAARSQGTVAFAIIISGAPEGQWEQEKYRVRMTLRQDKATKNTYDRVETLQTAMEKYLRTGEGETELRQLAETPHYKEVLDYVVKGGVLPPADHPIITWWRLNMDYQPLTIVPDIRCPVLSIWGEKDFLVDSHQAATMAASAFKKSEHPDYTWKIFRDADHGLYLRKEPGPGWAKDGSQFAPGFIELMTEWLLDRVTVQQAG